jgi:Na+/phosphate symporter
MSKFQIKSIFEQIAFEVFSIKDVNQAKQFITEFVSNKNIKDEDKKVIIDNVNACKNISRIQSYICNSLLRYEGMSLNK